MDALAASPLRLERIASLLKAAPVDALTTLSALQAFGMVERMPDGSFAASVRALHARSAIMHNVGS